MLAKIDAARAEGIDIAFDRYPYTAFSTGFSSFIPIELRDGTDEEVVFFGILDKADGFVTTDGDREDGAGEPGGRQV